MAAGERRARTLEIYRYHVSAHLLPSLGRRHLQAITADDLAELIAALQRKGLSAKTIAGALVPLGSILRFALRRVPGRSLGTTRTTRRACLRELALTLRYQ